MRWRHPDGSVVHLSYGTNVHPAETVAGLIGQLARYAGPVRSRLGIPRLGLGLWLPAEAVRELVTDRDLVERLHSALDCRGLEVVTVNAFPYAGFHAPIVKRAVYRPDWSERARLDYTLDCARVLAELLPRDVETGSISTVPLGWRVPWYADRAAAARGHLGELTEGLAKIAADTGRVVRVALEPEPGCVVESTEDIVTHLSGLDADHLGVCLDTAHLATNFEETSIVLEALRVAGIPVVKAQASAALLVEDPADPVTRAALADYAEDRFLHQVRERREGDGRVQARDDLDEAMGGHRPLPGRAPWRVHFHVPVHAEPAPPLRSTRDHLARSLSAMVGGPRAVVHHLEVETYTWGVLPLSARPDGDPALIDGIAAEVSWVADQLTELGLQPMEDVG